MNVWNNPLAKQIAGPLLDAVSKGPLGDVLEFVGVTNPDALQGIDGSPGGSISALYEAFGYDPQFADAIGAAADVSTGNVAGAASNATDAVGNDGGLDAFQLLTRQGIQV